MTSQNNGNIKKTSLALLDELGLLVAAFLSVFRRKRCLYICSVRLRFARTNYLYGWRLQATQIFGYGAHVVPAREMRDFHVDVAGKVRAAVIITSWARHHSRETLTSMCTEQEDGKLILGAWEIREILCRHAVLPPDADDRFLHFPLRREFITILAAKKWRLDTTSERGETKLFKLAG